jgi:hypothetical protein
MAWKTFAFATACGSIGGILGSLLSWYAVSATATKTQGVTYRASSYELVDNAGRVVGRWASDHKRGVTFTFFDETGFKAVELSAFQSGRVLQFLEGKNGWVRMNLVAASPGIANLTLGDDHRQGRLSIGDVDDRDVDTDEPPHAWGMVVRGSPFQYHLAAVVKNPSSATATSALAIRPPNQTFWTAP